MGEWLTATCQLLTSELAAGLGLLCVALAVVLLVVMALGFRSLLGVLGAPIGLAARRPGRDQAAGYDDGLLGTWRLYRQLGRLGRGAPPRR